MLPPQIPALSEVRNSARGVYGGACGGTGACQASDSRPPVSPGDTEHQPPVIGSVPNNLSMCMMPSMCEGWQGHQ